MDRVIVYVRLLDEGLMFGAQSPRWTCDMDTTNSLLRRITTRTSRGGSSSPGPSLLASRTGRVGGITVTRRT